MPGHDWFWLERLTAAQAEKEEGATIASQSWCIVFKVGSPRDPEALSEEAAEVIERMVLADLHVEWLRSTDGTEIYVTLGAREDVLVDEAAWHMVDHPVLVKIKSEDAVEPSLRGTCPFKRAILPHVRTTQDGFIFHSGHRQIIIKHRYERLTKIIFEVRLLMRERTEVLAKTQEKIDVQKPLQIFKMKELLEAYGCTLQTSNAGPMRERLPLAMQLYEQVMEMRAGDTLASLEVEPVMEELRKKDLNPEATTSGTLKEFFPLHDDLELQRLTKRWGTYAMLRQLTVVDEYGVKHFGPMWQPLDQLHDYCGGHVALYFAWVGLYTRWLLGAAVFGVFTMAGYFIFSMDANPLALGYSIFLSLWSTAFLESWKRTQNEMAFNWGSEGFEVSEKPRPTFKGKIDFNEKTGKYKLVDESASKKIIKLAVSLAVAVVFLASVITAAIMAYLVRFLSSVPAHSVDQYMLAGSNAGSSNGHFAEQVPAQNSKMYKYLSAMLCLCNMMIGEQIYKRVAKRLNKWENHRTQTEYDDSLIIKNFTFDFINNYFTLFYIAFMVHIEIIPGVQAGCQPAPTCMNALQTQLMIIFTGKAVINQVKQWAKAYFKASIRRKAQKRSVKKTMKSLSDEQQSDAASMSAHPLENERCKEPYESTFEDFKEMTVQFGYVTLFAASYPLAAALAWVNNVTELRLDAFQICNMHRRPMWRIQEDIGSWGSVLSFMSLVNVITNACLIAFVGAQLAPGTNSFIERFQKVELWKLVVAVEHAVFLSKVIIQATVADVPEWINDERDVMALMREEVLQPLIDADNSEINKLPNLGPEIVGASISAEMQQALDEPDQAYEELEGLEINDEFGGNDVDEKLLRVWNKIDVDGSGTLDQGELAQVMEALGKGCNESELAAAMKEMDEDGSGLVELSEFETWWEKQDPDAQEQLLLLDAISFADLPS